MYAKEDLKERMYAYLHIRNTVAHGFDGCRAERYASQFDRVMNSRAIPRMQSFDNTTIILLPYAWQGLKDFIPAFLSSILHRVINYGY